MRIEQPDVQATRFDRALAVHIAATARYRASLPTVTSFVDMVSLEFLASEAIAIAFVFDTDFESGGVEVIPARAR